MHWESVERRTEILLEMTLRGHHPKVDKNELDNNYSGVRRYMMRYKMPDVARGLRLMKPEKDKEIVASNQACRRVKWMKEVHVEIR